MRIAKRVFLFVITNILVVTTITILMSLLGVGPYLEANNLNIANLAVFCAVWGFGGAFISLAISRMMAKMMMGVKVIPADTREPELRWLVDTVYRHSKRAGLTTMPEVGIYESPEMNAFATGPTRNRSLVAVSTGLLQAMNQDEAEGVIAHEVAHVANGDMVTMTLVQGVVNAFVMFFARIIAFAVSQAVHEDSRAAVRFGVTILLEIVLGFLGMIVVAWFSRYREFRADAGGAQLAGREKMVGALQALQRRFEPLEKNEAMAPLQISGRSRSGFVQLFSTHPPLELRIARLNRARI